MRTLSYYLDMADTFDGYRIDNLFVSDKLPNNSLPERPSIRVTNIRNDRGLFGVDIAKCVKLGEYDEADCEDMNEEPEEISEDFAQNYARILRGEIPEWVLCCVSIKSDFVLLAFRNKGTDDCGYLHISAPWPMRLDVMFEVACEDGGTDKYHLNILCDTEYDDAMCTMTLTEYEGNGKRELNFMGSHGGTNERVVVKEYR